MIGRRLVRQMGFVIFLHVVFSLEMEAQIQKGMALIGKVPGEQFGRNTKL